MRITRRYHFTVSFALFAGVTVLLGVGAINSQNNLLFFCFGAALAGLLLSGVVSGSALMRVRVRRLSVGDAFVGAPLRIVYEVEHRGRGMPAFALRIEERKGGSGAAKATWARLMPHPLAFVPFVARGKASHAEAVVVPTRRGVATLADVRIVTTFPFGAIKKSVLFAPGASGEGLIEVPVRPAIVDLPPALARRVAAASRDADRASRRVGRGDEFFGVREYAPGDSVRRIAWRASARSGDLVVREDAAFDSSRLTVVLVLSRAGASAARDESDERAISLAASVLVRTAKGGVAVGLSVPSATLRFEPGSGDARLASMLDALARLGLDDASLDRTRTNDPIAERDATVVIDADGLAALERTATPRGGAAA